MYVDVNGVGIINAEYRNKLNRFCGLPLGSYLVEATFTGTTNWYTSMHKGCKYFLRLVEKPDGFHIDCGSNRDNLNLVKRYKKLEDVFSDWDFIKVDASIPIPKVEEPRRMPQVIGHGFDMGLLHNILRSQASDTDSMILASQIYPGKSRMGESLKELSGKYMQEGCGESSLLLNVNELPEFPCVGLNKSDTDCIQVKVLKSRKRGINSSTNLVINVVCLAEGLSILDVINFYRG